MVSSAHGAPASALISGAAGAARASAQTSFLHRAETFGLDGGEPWALPALRLVCNVPRVYTPLLDAFDDVQPGVREQVQRLHAMGFVAYQSPILIDTRTGAPVAQASRPVDRWRTTSSGHRLRVAAFDDPRILQDTFSQLGDANVAGVLRLLDAFDLEDSHARFGLSASHAITLSRLPERTGRWWVQRLAACGYVRKLPVQLPDCREVVPGHWRVTKSLLKHVSQVLEAFPEAGWAHLAAELRLSRAKVLEDISPARVGISGATDFDHDVTTQRILAAMVRSPRFAPAGVFVVEPRLSLPVDDTVAPWRFQDPGQSGVAYQPDAEFRELRSGQASVRSLVEYERYQSRRDAWSHIERFCGYLHTRTMPFEPAVLRFVVDSRARMRSYIELVEAFADHGLDHPEWMPANRVTLAVADVDSLLRAPDPLDDRVWARIVLPAREDGAFDSPVLHAVNASPYERYFRQG